MVEMCVDMQCREHEKAHIVRWDPLDVSISKQSLFVVHMPRIEQPVESGSKGPLLQFKLSQSNSRVGSTLPTHQNTRALHSQKCPP